MLSLRKLEIAKRKTQSHPKEAHLMDLGYLGIACLECKCKIFWVQANDNFIVCSHCSHIWLMKEHDFNPSRRKNKE